MSKTKSTRPLRQLYWALGLAVVCATLLKRDQVQQQRNKNKGESSAC